MTTAQQIIDMVPFPDSVKTTASSLAAINDAIATSWPAFKLEETASAGIFVTLTYEYSLTAVAPAIPPDLGPAEVLIDEATGLAKTIHHDYTQWYDRSGGCWYLRFSPFLVEGYVGKTFYVHYQYPHPQITGLGETVYLPIGYAVRAASLWYDFQQAAENLADSALTRALAPEFLRAQTLALRGAYVRQLPVKIGTGKERLT